MSAPTRAPARGDEMTAAWYDGLRTGRLMLRACPQGHLNRPDVLACDVCSSFDLEWADSRGRGLVVACGVDHATSPPTPLVVVELAEGPWLMTRVEEGEVARGDDVVIRIAHPGEGEPYPVVVPARSAETAERAERAES
jgi:uncharacterized OB-fold protein